MYSAVEESAWHGRPTALAGTAGLCRRGSKEKKRKKREHDQGARAPHTPGSLAGSYMSPSARSTNSNSANADSSMTGLPVGCLYDELCCTFTVLPCTCCGREESMERGFQLRRETA